MPDITINGAAYPVARRIHPLAWPRYLDGAVWVQDGQTQRLAVHRKGRPLWRFWVGRPPAWAGQAGDGQANTPESV